MSDDLDWSLVTDESIFQRLVNDLFAFEVGFTSMIPSDPNIGADGGFDGLIDGEIPFLSRKGKVSLQAKSVKDTFTIPSIVRKRMRSYLLGDKNGKGEIKKAIDNKCDGLILVTNGKLTTPYVKELENLKPKELKFLKVMGRSRLRNRIILYPFILKYYFNKKVSPTFIPPRMYFDNKEDLTDGFNITNKETEVMVEQFLEDSSKRIFSIYSLGGTGKSHLLMNLSKYDSTNKDHRILLVTDESCTGIEEDIKEEILESATDREYVLILDDVDRRIDVFEIFCKLLNRVNSPKVKFVISSRRSSMNVLRDLFMKYRLSSTVLEYELPKWSDEDLVGLFHHYNPEEPEGKIQHYIRVYRTPYLISWVARKSVGEDLDAHELQDKLRMDSHNEVSLSLASIPFDNVTLDRFLLSTLLILPFSEGDQSAIGFVSEFSSLEEKTVRGCLEFLLRDGVMRTVGGKLRMDPDVKGDVLLSYLLDKQSLGELEDLIEKSLIAFGDNVFFNLSESVQYGRSDFLAQLIATQISGWESTLNDGGNGYVRNMIKRFSYVFRLNPTESFNLLSVLVSKSEELNLNTDDIGPLVKLAFQCVEIRNDVLYLFLSAYRSIPVGTYDNYKLKSLAQWLLNPLYNYQYIELTLRYFAENLSNFDIQEIKVILLCIAEILKASHEYDESYGNTITFGQKVLRPSDVVLSWRKVALDILLKISNIPNEFYIQELFEVAESIGNQQGLVKTAQTDMYDLFLNEQQEFIENLSLKKLNTLSPIGKVVCEGFLLTWWAQEMEGDVVAWGKMDTLEKDDLYLAISAMLFDRTIGLSGEYVKKAIEKSIVEFASNSRWNVFVSLIHDDEFQKLKISQIVDRLSDDIETFEQLLAFLKEIISIVGSNETAQWSWDGQRSLIRTWVDKAPGMFLEMWTHSSEEIPEEFKSLVESSLVASDNLSIDKLVDYYKRTLNSRSNREISNVLQLITERRKDLFPEIFSLFIRKLNVEKLNFASHALWNFYRESKEAEQSLAYFKILLKSYNQITERSLDYLSFLIGNIKKDRGVVTLDTGTKRRLVRLVIHTEKLSFHHFQLIRDLKLSGEETLSILNSRMKIEELCSVIKYHNLTKREDSLIFKRVFEHLHHRLISLRLNIFNELNSKDKIANYDAFLGKQGFSDPILNIEEYDDFSKTIDQLFRMGQGFKGFRRDYDLKKISLELVSAEVSDYGWYLRKIQESLEYNDTQMLLFLFKMLPIYRTEPNELSALLVSCWDMFDEKGRSELRSILHGKAATGSFSSTIGAPSPEHLKRKAYFAELNDLVLGNDDLSALCMNIVSYLDSRIENTLQVDEEFLERRR